LMATNWRSQRRGQAPQPMSALTVLLVLLFHREKHWMRSDAMHGRPPRSSSHSPPRGSPRLRHLSRVDLVADSTKAGAPKADRLPRGRPAVDPPLGGRILLCKCALQSTRAPVTMRLRRRRGHIEPAPPNCPCDAGDSPGPPASRLLPGMPRANPESPGRRPRGGRGLFRAPDIERTRSPLGERPGSLRRRLCCSAFVGPARTDECHRSPRVSSHLPRAAARRVWA